LAQDGWAALQGQLGAPPPESLRRLGDAELRDLAGAIADARRRQAAELAAAGEAAFGHIPRLLRAPLRKVLG
jgi:NaMN:DMB phosphoribosyltransferase